MQFGMSNIGRLLASVEVRSTFLNQIKSRQSKDEKLTKLLNNVVCGEASDDTLDAYGILMVRYVGGISREGSCVYSLSW